MECLFAGVYSSNNGGGGSGATTSLSSTGGGAGGDPIQTAPSSQGKHIRWVREVTVTVLAQYVCMLHLLL